jgi:hypothetical protein
MDGIMAWPPVNAFEFDDLSRELVRHHVELARAAVESA